MTSVWSSRPPMPHQLLFFAAYILGCAFAQMLAIVPGTGISVWPPSGLFLATLIVAPVRSWPWWVMGGCLAELVSNAIWFHSPLPAALLIYVGNALEATVGAWLVNRVCGRPVRLESLREVLSFVALGAGVAPLISATIGSATLAAFAIKSQSFAEAWPLFFIGDATGTLLVAPLALVALQHWRSKIRLTSAQQLEAAVLGLIFLCVAALSLSDFLPFSFVIMPPLLWAAVRFEFKGVAVALTLLVLITLALTLSGDSHFVGEPETQRQKQFMLQLFLVISAFSALIVAAISRQYQLALVTLRQSERQLQQLVDALPVHIWSWTPAGELAYVNKRSAEDLGLSGASFEDITRVAQKLVHPEDAPEVLRTSSNCLKTGDPFVMRYRRRWKDGNYRWIEARAHPLRNEDGAIAHWYQVSLDIDEEVQAQQALRDRERELSQIVNMVPVHIRRLTPEGVPTFFNKRLLDFFGLDTVEQLDKPGMSRLAAAIRSLVHPQDSDQLFAAVRHSLASGEPYAMKYRMLRADGTYRWVDGRAEPVRDEFGAIVQWFVISVDINDEVRAQEELREREREYSQLVNMVPSYLWRLTPDGTPNFFNQRLMDFLGLDVDSIEAGERHPLSAIIQEVVHPDDAAQMGEALRNSIATGDRFSMRYRLRRTDGVYRWVEGSAEPTRDENGNIIQWHGLSNDIDDQVHAEEALRDSKQQLEQMIDALPINILSFDASRKMTYTSRRYLDHVGLPPAHVEDFEALARDVAHPDDFPTMFGRASNGFTTGQPFVNRFRRSDSQGVYRWIEARAQPLRDCHGAIVQWYIVSIDIEEEMRAVEALRESELHLRRLVDALPTQIWAAAANGEPSYLNRRLAEYVGLTLDDLSSPESTRLQMAIQNSVHPDDAPSVGQALLHSFTTGEAFAMKYRQRRADGVYRWINGRAEPLRDANGSILQWYGVSFDIDDDIRTQEELRLTQDRLAIASQAASLAELSASIAHEVNQPLAAIVANSHACHRWLSISPPNVERAMIIAERIIRDANSAADVVSRIRALFKQSVENRRNIGLASVVSEACDLMADEATRRRVRFECNTDKALPPVSIDRTQIQQVLINLIRNGMEAMDSLTGEKVLGITVHRVGDEVQAEIRDGGSGIDSPDRIFEPFFTTKETGMGMGLAVCRSIVESHGGRLWAEKNEPNGSRFIFALPIEEKATP